MKSSSRTRLAIVMVTAPDRKTARKLAQAALCAHLAACVNLVPGLESHYWWGGKLENGTEVLLLLKSSFKQLAALERCIISLHPYDTPEFVVLPVTRGNKRYLDWWARSLIGSSPP